MTAIAATFERRRIDSYGLPVGQAFGKFFWKGMLAGLLVVMFVASAMILTGAMAVHGLALQRSLCPFGLLRTSSSVSVEENTFRGYALRSLWRSAAFWPAALITTGIFAGTIWRSQVRTRWISA